MIYLGDCRDNISIVAGQWELSLREFLFKKHKIPLRIKKGKGYEYYDTYYDKMEGKVVLSNVSKSKKESALKELRRFKNHFREIVLAEEKDLEDYSKEQVSESMKNLMIGLYEDFTKAKHNTSAEQTKQDEQVKKKEDISNAHYFFRELNIRTCPYCNRHYTFTYSKKNNKVSPEYDHFYDKSSHPLVAVSFYNLVPSCHTCNHVKGTRETARINPFFSGFKSKFMLQDEKGDKLMIDYDKVSMKEKRNDYGKLTYSGLTDDENGNVETFALKGLYEMHDDYIKELVDKVIAYNPTVRQSLVDAFQDQAYSPQQVYDFVWGRYLEEAQYGNRPLSKLTKDILEQLGILPDNDFH